MRPLWGCPHLRPPWPGVVVMARPSYRIRVRGRQRQPIDVDLLAQVVLMLAADRDDTDDLATDSGAVDPVIGQGRSTTDGGGKR